MFDKLVHHTEGLFTKILIVMTLAFIGFELVEMVVKFVLAVGDYNIITGREGNGEKHPFATFGIIFFNVLIALELIETLKIKDSSYQARARLILLIGLIAVSRKILTLGIGHMEYENLYPIAALVAALSLGYFFLNKHKGKSD